MKEAQPNQSQYCKYCWSMTTTFSGLTALCSEHGYQHDGKQALIDSTAEGCLLCNKISSIAYRHGWWDLPGPWLRHHRLRVIAQYEHYERGYGPKLGEHQQKLGEILGDYVIQNFRLAFPDEHGTITGNDGRWSFPIHTTKSNYAISRSRIFYSSRSDDACRPFVAKPLSFETITSDWMFQQLQFCLKECESTHDGCKGYELTSLPTRVLDIAINNGSTHVKLYATEKNEQGRYVALSYCWGGGPRE
jgi:hypothetical protein